MAGSFTLIKFKYSIQSRENHKWPKKRKNPRFNITLNLRRFSREDFLKPRESLSFTEAFSTQIMVFFRLRHVN